MSSERHVATASARTQSTSTADTLAYGHLSASSFINQNLWNAS
jgi:hypothetical protein